MVSFVCNFCQETLKKPKLDAHAQRCRNASFSCIDCSTDFVGTAYRQHTSCVSEAEKYEGKLYKKGKAKGEKATNSQQQASGPRSTVDQLTAARSQKALSEAAPEVAAATGAKRKHGESSDTSTKNDKKPKDRAAGSDWDSSDLPASAVEAVVRAITHVSKHEPDTEFGALKKKCIRMVAKHPKSSVSKSDAKGAFDKAVVAALAGGMVRLQ
ncbi:hypothetical protein GGF46_001079 [Coemansia sp. RSA 552]|nr:hypothetical protein GGF46_001079 [Coemansia sp. RSA 552]